ncbi:MAG: hypothetical protein LUO79_04940 [Methanomassiliicoccales archaeon]|nr:hypothetical protein [Methanomassiliicoccales archaeon]
MTGLWNGKLLVVDLAKMEIAEIGLDDSLVLDGVGGTGVASLLWRRFQEKDPIVLGTGPFTATMVPGSALATATMFSPDLGRLVHSPIVSFAGAELKLSGFDFLILHGKALEPVYLWLRDGIADLLPAGEWWGKDTWRTADGIRSEQGDDRIQVLSIGPAGEQRMWAAQVVVDHWSEGDKIGLGARFGSMNLKAVCSRGLGELSVSDPDAMFDSCRSLQRDAIARIAGRSGIGSVLPGIDLKDTPKIVHRDSACRSCPWPCRTFLKYNEPPTVMAEGVEEPGVLVADAPGYAALIVAGFDAVGAARLLEQCSRLGIDPVPVSGCLNGLGCADAMKKLERLAGIEPSFVRTSGEYTRPDVFSRFAPNGGSEKDIALAYLLGICPRYAALAGIDAPEHAEALSFGTGMEIKVEDLLKATRLLLE